MQQLMNKSSSLTSTPVQKRASVSLENSMWRKDFTISGQIGEPGQKDRLTFSSLARQIEGRLRLPEDEIMDAVICTITPGLHLRNYLEGKGDLTLGPTTRGDRSH